MRKSTKTLPLCILPIGMFPDVRRTLPFLLIFLIGFSVLSISLWFPPTYNDDIRYLTTVERTPNPLSYFVSDQGHDNNLYRPLATISLWVTYKIFGIWAFPNQLVTLCLHIITACILYRIIFRLRKDEILSFLVTLLFLVSPLTFWTATQVSDRHMALVGVIFVMFLNHILFTKKISVPLVTTFSVLAVLSKESGLILLLLSIYLGLQKKNTGLVVCSLLTIFFYALLRFLIFGPGVADYSQNGYLLGWIRYDHPMDLAFPLNWLAYFENMVKNMAAVFFPVFSGTGALLRDRSAIFLLPAIILSPALFLTAFTKKLSKIQIFSLVIILLNGILHFALFRYRVLYLAQMAFCLFLISSPLFSSKGNEKRIRIFEMVTVVLLFYSAIWIIWWLSTHLVQRHTVNFYAMDHFLSKPSLYIDNGIIQKIKFLYTP